MSKARRLFYEDIAELRGVKVSTVTVDAARSRMARRHPERHYVRKSHDMPEPDGYTRRSPWWYESTIHKWLDNRPGANNQDYIDARRDERRDAS